MIDYDSPWTAEDVPDGPYFHGTRFRVEPGASFDHEAPAVFAKDYPFGLVNTAEGEEDQRIRYWATTDPDEALRWAYQKGGRFAYAHPGRFDRLFVWEVALDDPEVDINAHRSRWPQSPVTNVMGSSGQFVRIVPDMAVAEYPFERLLD